MAGPLDELSQCLLVAAYIRDPAGAQTKDVAADLHVDLAEAHRKAVALYHADWLERAAEGGTIRAAAEARSDVRVLVARFMIQTKELSEIDRAIVNQLAKHGRLEGQAIGGGFPARNESLVDAAINLRKRSVVKFPGAHVTIANLSAELDARGWLYVKLSSLTAKSINDDHVPLAKEWILNRLSVNGTMGGEAMSEKSRYSILVITEAIKQLGGDGLVKYSLQGFKEIGQVVASATITAEGKRIVDQTAAARVKKIQMSNANARSPGVGGGNEAMKLSNEERFLLAAQKAGESTPEVIGAAAEPPIDPQEARDLAWEICERDRATLDGSDDIYFLGHKGRNLVREIQRRIAEDAERNKPQSHITYLNPDKREVLTTAVVRPPTLAPTPVPAPPAEMPTAPMHNVEQEIVAALKDGPLTLADLFERVGRGQSSVRKAVDRLKGKGYITHRLALPDVGDAGIEIAMAAPGGDAWAKAAVERAESADEPLATGKYIVRDGSTSTPGTWCYGLVKGSVFDAALFPISSLKHLLLHNTIRPATPEDVAAFDAKLPLSVESVQATQREVEALKANLAERAAAAKSDSDKARLCHELIKELGDKQAEIKGVENSGNSGEVGDEATLRLYTLRGRRIQHQLDLRQLIKTALREVMDPAVMVACEGLGFPSNPLHDLLDRIDQNYAGGSNPDFAVAIDLLRRIQYRLMSQEKQPPVPPTAAAIYNNSVHVSGGAGNAVSTGSGNATTAPPRSAATRYQPLVWIVFIACAAVAVIAWILKDAQSSLVSSLAYVVGAVALLIAVLCALWLGRRLTVKAGDKLHVEVGVKD
jgi:hypothetical protein